MHRSSISGDPGLDPRGEVHGARGRLPRVMGILNVTPDSFSDGGRFDTTERAVAHAHALVEAGADILDIGGESTRPGSDPVPVDEELARVAPVLEALGPQFPIPISIDTRRAAVAAQASDLGVSILNDTAALRDDPELAPLAAERELDVVLMHRRGVPRTMQHDIAAAGTPYEDVVDDVRGFLDERVGAAMAAGIARERITVDPGIGFGKRPEDNDRLLSGLDRLRLPGIPLLVGASRKAFLGRFDPRNPEARLPGSLAVCAICVQHAVEIVRVHDVADTVAFLRTLSALGGFTLEGGEPCRR